MNDRPDSGMNTDGKVIDVKTFWRAIGVRAVGAAVVAGEDANGPAGFLALSVTHLCADPPMMLVSIGKQTSALSAILNGRHFGISYLARGHEALADSFGGRGPLKGADRFEPGLWTKLTTGAPLLAGAVGALDCAIEETIERHGTVIAIGRLVNYASNPGLEPLISFGGGYR